ILWERAVCDMVVALRPGPSISDRRRPLGSVRSRVSIAGRTCRRARLRVLKKNHGRDQYLPMQQVGSWHSKRPAELSSVRILDCKLSYHPDPSRWLVILILADGLP